VNLTVAFERVQTFGQRKKSTALAVLDVPLGLAGRAVAGEARLAEVGVQAAGLVEQGVARRALVAHARPGAHDQAAARVAGGRLRGGQKRARGQLELRDPEGGGADGLRGVAEVGDVGNGLARVGGAREKQLFPQFDAVYQNVRVLVGNRVFFVKSKALKLKLFAYDLVPGVEVQIRGVRVAGALDANLQLVLRRHHDVSD
jgi:hypothetical protein